MTTTRKCHSCNESKPITKQYFHINGDGYPRKHCRKCLEAEWQERAEKAKELDGQGSKICTKCNQDKSYDSFGKRLDSADGRAHHCLDCRKNDNAIYREKNREEIRRKDKEKYHSDIDAGRARKRKYYKPHPLAVLSEEERKTRFQASQIKYRRANREKINKKTALWYQNNKKRKQKQVKAWTNRNLDRVRAKGRRYKKNNRGKLAQRQAIRRAMLNQATPSWAWIEIEQIQSLYLKAAKLGQHVDHIVPLKSKIVCGLHCMENLRILPAKQNIQKSNRFWPDMPLPPDHD